MTTTLAGKVIRQSDSQALAHIPVRLVASAAEIGALPAARTYDGVSWGWTRQVTGVVGTRWECWERLLQNKVAGLRWEDFCDPSLLVNPALQSDHLFRADEVYVLPEPSVSPRFAWTQQVTGFAGTRWECWERFLKGAVAGLRWEDFCDSSLLVNPALQSDHLFSADQTYCIPAPLTGPLAYLDTWTDADGTYQFALADNVHSVTISASAPGVSGSTALRVDGATVFDLVLGPAAPPALVGVPAEQQRPTATMAAAAASGSVRSTRPDYGALPAVARRVIDQALFMLGDDAATFDALLPQHQRMCYGSLFIHAPADLHYKDICCADLVSVSLAAAGLDITWSAYNGNTRMADYYHPHNGDGKLVEVAPTDDYLAGDVFVFGRGDRESRAIHVALYVGPFAGTDRSGHVYPAAKGYEAVEGSIDMPSSRGEQGTAVRGIPLASCLNGEYGTFSWIRRVRLRQLAQAFGR